jgi:uncharacterized membrane protein
MPSINIQINPVVKNWLLLITLILSTGGAVTLTAHAGGATWLVSIISGLITGASNVFHALNDSPNDAPQQPKP